jgi:hypothetical protein
MIAHWKPLAVVFVVLISIPWLVLWGHTSGGAFGPRIQLAMQGSAAGCISHSLVRCRVDVRYLPAADLIVADDAFF